MYNIILSDKTSFIFETFDDHYYFMFYNNLRYSSLCLNHLSSDFSYSISMLQFGQKEELKDINYLSCQITNLNLMDIIMIILFLDLLKMD